MEGVVHDRNERLAGRRATYQLDITARDPKGEIKRLLVECKDWNVKVEQDAVSTLVGVRDQVGAEAAAILTTEGFKRGALNVAIDEDIALVRLAPYDPAKHGTNFATRITVTMNRYTQVHFDFGCEVGDTAGLTGSVHIPAMTGEDHFLLQDGSAAVRLLDVLRANASPTEEGSLRQRAELKPGRFLPTVEGPAVEIAAMTETNHLHMSEIVHEAEGSRSSSWSSTTTEDRANPAGCSSA
jgi:hypothetical protein